MNEVIYLDNNATTKPAPEVVEAMLPFLKERYGNPSSMYSFGGDVAKAVDNAREQVAALLNCLPEEIIFTSCGTESDNMAARGRVLAGKEKSAIVTSKVEHPAILNTCRSLKAHGSRLEEIGVDSKGALDMGALDKALLSDVAIATIMWGNNETGVLFPIADIAEKVKEKGIVFHTDAVQAVGKVPIDLAKVPVDMLSLSGHKLHAPKGIGALFIRKGTKISPYMTGGHQERNLRGGTENVPYIVALGKACELARKEMDQQIKYISTLRDKLERELLKACPDTSVNGGGSSERLPNTTNISFQYVEGEAILLLMNELNICASSGSACTSGSLDPSHVLKAMDIPFTKLHGSIRFSLSHYNTEEEIDFVIKELPPIIERLRKISPFGRD
jgi:cysteine desulfurase